MPKAHRLSRAEFAARAVSRRVHGQLFSLSVSPLRAGRAKFACVVAKKVIPGAVRRNQLKRRCREAAAVAIRRIDRPLAIVLHAKRGTATASFPAIRQEIDTLLQSLQ